MCVREHGAWFFNHALCMQTFLLFCVFFSYGVCVCVYVYVCVNMFLFLAMSVMCLCEDVCF